MLLVATACSQPGNEEGHVLWLADLVETQADNVSTDLVAVPEEVGLDRIRHGWRREAPAYPLDAHLEMDQRIGRLEVFSADGDIASMQLELSLPDDGPESVETLVLLNDERVGLATVRHGWSTHDFEVRAGLSRRGRNYLNTWTEPTRRSVPASELPVRLRRLRLRSGSGRAAWTGRPALIQTRATGVHPVGGRKVEMPVASFVDVVLPLPSGAGITGELSVEPAAPSRSGRIEAYIRLLDEEQREHTLLEERFASESGGRRRVAADLSRWSGQLVRIRWGVTGSGNGVIRWLDTAVRCPEPIEAPVLPPIARVVPARSGRLGRPDVILILLDAARADAFSPFGGPHKTPALDRLAGDGTIFTRAIAPASWTGQSVPAILTGQSPDALGVGGWGSDLPDGVPTLGELAAAAGYRTVLWSQHLFYWGSNLVTRFEETHRAPPKDYEALPRPSDLHRKDGPTLAFVHLIPPHAPYTPPAPFLGAYSSWYSGKMDVSPRQLHRAARRGVSAEDVRFARDRYLENAAFADHLVGRILDDLDRAGRYDDALVVVLSDHGEAFVEHRRFMHTRFLHHEYVHVPLIIKWPSSATGFRSRVTDPVSLLDLVPTLVDGLALTGAHEGFMGRDLLPVVFAGESREPAVYSLTRGVSDPKRVPVTRQMLQLGNWRILYSPLEDASQLYRADHDPKERVDLAQEQPLQALRLRQGVLAQSAWNRILHHHSERESEATLDDPEMIEQLEALGYVN